MAVLREYVERSAWFNLFVSCSFRRRRRIDSGVGDEGEMGNWRFCEVVIYAMLYSLP